MKKSINLLTLALFLLLSCKKNDMPKSPADKGPDQMVYAINMNNELIGFNARKPDMNTSRLPISGLPAGEKLLSIDFRPATGELYALSDASKLYIINQTNGKARVVGESSFTPAINGNVASIDFNPTVDRIRLVSATGQDLRLNPETGAVVATDGNINGGNSPVITGIAYTNPKAGASSTTLFDIDQTSGKLYKQIPPNNGTLVEAGSLGITVTGTAAFDITPENIPLLAVSGKLYVVDTTTGRAIAIGSTAETYTDIAVPTEPVAYAVDLSNNLLIFNHESKNPITISKSITGLQAGESIVGIDFRPLNGQLYALGSSSRIYTINLSNGAAAQVGSGMLTTLLAGTEFGFDFNPLVDRIRVVSNTGQNLRLNPTDGSVSGVDGMLNPGSPMVSGAAYTNSFAGATTTTLFVIDHLTDKLLVQNPPNAGTLTEVGGLGADISATNGFDISGRNGKAYLIAWSGNSTRIYTVNLETGKVKAEQNFSGMVTGFSIAPGF